MPVGTSGLTLKEADIQRTICDFLRAEQWHVFEFEQEWSARKKKLLGEEGMPDVLAIRYSHIKRFAQVLWCEMKRIDKRGRLTKPSPAQRVWKLLEQKRGALVWTLGEECEPSFEAFRDLYRSSGLQRR